MNNSVTIVGHVGQKPTTKEFPSGKKVVKFSVAVKEYTTAKEDPQTIWFDVQCWNEVGDSVVAHITKGREVVVQGRLAIDEYIDWEGCKVKKPVINMTGFHLCGRKLGSVAENQPEAENHAAKPKKAAA